MAVTMHMHPNDPPLSWKAFCKETPPYSIALDGYVAAGPRFDEKGPHLNLNHHEEVDRLATRATCAQVLMAFRQGLGRRFRTEQGFQAEVFMNDCDEDVCLSWYLLRHGYLAEQIINPRLNRLVAMEDALDATAGAYPFPIDMPALSELAWIFEPYRRFRASGELDRREADAFCAVLTDVENRIHRHLHGDGGSLPLDCRYRKVGGGRGWSMIEEIGAHARTAAFADGIDAYVAVRERPDGHWTYTIGRMSIFVDFDVLKILAALNQEEGTTDDRWGGGNTIGGSPRVCGSRLTPAEVEKLIDRVLANPPPNDAS